MFQANILSKLWLLSATVTLGSLLAIVVHAEATGSEKLAGRGQLGNSSLGRRGPTTAHCTHGYNNPASWTKVPPNTVGESPPFPDHLIIIPLNIYSIQLLTITSQSIEISACMFGNRPMVCPSITCSFRFDEGSVPIFCEFGGSFPEIVSSGHSLLEN